jgi:ATP sulfurylase
MDVEQIALGAFSPLEGFMSQAELNSVLLDYRLPSGVVWPLPILFQVTREEAQRFKEGQTIGLTMRNTNNDIYGTLKIEEIYTSDLDVLAKKIFGTNDPGHPGVQLFKQRGRFFLSGPVELLKRLPNPSKKYELTPLQTRAIFESKGWSKVVGFHTRNVIHQAHEVIQMTALKDYNCDGLFVHPIIGLKKEGDYAENIIIKSYELMIDRYYPKGKVVLGAFSTYSRYAGPREAVFTALCRKNFGCSHFIVDRNNADFLR